ncbi:uncharacterized protein SAPINGB_P002575 [Magnusiomyces paraingens]|uniref:Protein DSF2 n=1 Tax=Magnusiomyces paraingens TaxID=2606893 RepID=A0A5E8BEW0_9ASCO|nr:uncharacterized protein SAPINGB_P002575 [Saprochaete ingens]VVT50049.1 unnamed protein product [Saprochaete ingens]
MPENHLEEEEDNISVQQNGHHYAILSTVPDVQKYQSATPSSPSITPVTSQKQQQQQSVSSSPNTPQNTQNNNQQQQQQQQQSLSPKAPTTALSPLELLEQRSRRLANRFGKKPNDDIQQAAPNNDHHQQHQHPQQQQTSSSSSLPKSTQDSTLSSDNIPTTRRGRIARKASTASITSIASLGSILGSFRLSSLSIDDSVDLTPTTSAASFYPNQQQQQQHHHQHHQQYSSQVPTLTVSQSQAIPATFSTPNQSSQSLGGGGGSRRGNNNNNNNNNNNSNLHHYPTSPGFVPLSSKSSISTTLSSTSRTLHSPPALPVSPPAEPEHHPVLISSGSHGSLNSINENNNNINNNINTNINASSSYSSLAHSPKLKALPAPRAKLPAFPPTTPASIGLHPRTANQRSFSGSSLSSIASGKQITATPTASTTTSTSTATATATAPSASTSITTTSTHSRTPSSSHNHLPSHQLSEFELLKEKRINNTLTLEDHVALGIYFHEEGNLRESSYHWQHAAFQGETTAMLLYGLALRHGWGIRKNPESAVEWLLRAIKPILHEYKLEDILQNQNSTERFQAFLSSSNDTSTQTGGKIKKTHVSLAFYELGMCYLNAWGIDKDEDLALRCFELAGSLGDPDALSEAARMWMHNGPKGRKKDYMRAAKLYRLAEKNGANVVSNSWIYKDKYMDPDEDEENLKKSDKDRRRSGILKKMKK